MKKQSKIIFIDQNSVGNHHMVFNASVLKILQNIYQLPIHHVGIASNQKSVGSLCTKQQKSQIILEPLNLSSTNSTSIIAKGFNYIKKEIQRYHSFKNILKKSDDKTIIYLSTTTIPMYVVFKLMKRKYKTKVVSFLHGEIDYLYRADNFSEKVNAFLIQKYLTIKAVNYYYCVLNKISRDSIIKDGFLSANKLMDINHPIESKFKPNTKVSFSYPILLGHIGSLDKNLKNSHYIYKLGLSLRKYIDQEKIFFKNIGLLTPSVIPYKNALVKEIVGNEKENQPKYLDRKTYENEVNTLHFCLFFYPKKNYVFRASGAITDAIALEIPIIVIKHPFFDYLFEIGGDIGYICNSLKEIKQEIENILSDFDEQRYLKQKENIRQLKKIFSLEEVSKDFKTQLSERDLFEINDKIEV